MKENLTFDELPNRVTMLIQEISDLKRLLSKKQDPNEEPEKFLTIQEAAAFLNLTVPTMYSKVSRRDLPAMKRGKRLYFSNIELREYLKEGRKKSNIEIQAEAEAYLSNKKNAAL